MTAMPTNAALAVPETSRVAVPLAQVIRIGAGFTRSINLPRDRDAAHLLRGYIPTSRALDALSQMATGLDREAKARSLALIGPFGSGKSAFALFASALFADPTSAASRTAMARLQADAPRLAQQLHQAVAGSRGLLRVPINGTPDSLVRQVLLAFADAVERADLSATLAQRIRGAARPGQRMDHVLDLIDQVQDAWAKTGGMGVLLVIDELGKFLEFEAHHPGQREMHLLQLLAEKSGAAGPAPLHLLVLLHQAFEHYSNRLGKSLRDEWQKIQGRFATVAFLEPAEQSLRIVGAAFERDVDLSSAVAEQLFEISSQLTQACALPLGFDPGQSIELFTRCYPLHPITLLILPVLCQKVAQNERTLFSYLGSTEPFGLRRRLDQLRMGDWIGPWELYDFFILNQAVGFADPLTYHRWVEVATALERYDGDTSAGSIDPGTRLLKTIGVLNLIGAQRGLKASQALLQLAFDAPVDQLIERLEQVSIIQFRRYSREFRVWQGSDFDLHGALRQATAEQSSRSLPDLLNELAALPPVVARRASIETGTFRRFTPAFTSAERWPPSPPPAELVLWLYLADADEARGRDGRHRLAVDLSALPDHHVLAVCHSTEQLREVLTEWLALRDMPAQYPALQQDAVAQREHQTWLTAAETEALGSIRALLEAPESLNWYFGGTHRDIRSRRHLQQVLSRWVQDTCFPRAPIIRNELINREYPSAAASTGRKKLLAAMLQAPERDGLGIEKAPAEKSLYLSLLRESRLHRKGADGRWDFFPPHPPGVPNGDPCKLWPAWDAMRAVLGDAGERQVPVSELFAHLQAPPYGIRLGVLPILIITYLLAHRREVALYQEGAFCEVLTLDAAELLCRRPALFALERFTLSGLRGDLFQRYLGSIVGNLREDATLLDIVRPLMRFAANLPEYSQHCIGLSAEAERVRQAFRQAKRPGLLLFETLPKACGIDPAAFAGDAPEPVERFIGRLIATLRELSQAYPNLLAAWQQILADQLLDHSPGDLAALRRALAGRFRGLDRYAPQQSTISAFIRRLADTHFDTDQAWLESVMTLLAKAPPAKWRDAHRVHAELRLREFAEHLRDLDRLAQALPASQDAAQFSGEAAVMVKLVESAAPIAARVVRVTARQRHQAEQRAAAIAAQLQDLDQATRTAVVASLIKRLDPSQAPEDDLHD